MEPFHNWLGEKKLEIKEFGNTIEYLKNSYNSGCLTFEEFDYLWKAYVYLRDTFESIGNK